MTGGGSSGSPPHPKRLLANAGSSGSPLYGGHLPQAGLLGVAPLAAEAPSGFRLESAFPSPGQRMSVEGRPSHRGLTRRSVSQRVDAERLKSFFRTVPDGALRGPDPPPGPSSPACRLWCQRRSPRWSSWPCDQGAAAGVRKMRRAPHYRLPLVAISGHWASSSKLAFRLLSPGSAFPALSRYGCGSGCPEPAPSHSCVVTRTRLATTIPADER